jgi:hypothetical protein
MQPLDDFNPDIVNQGPVMSPLELIGALVIVIIVGVGFQYIMSSDEDFNKKWKN